MALKRNIGNLDLDRLQEVLNYDPETGWFTWRVKRPYGRKPGDRAGSVTVQGYRRINIDGRSYTASHLAWFYFYGEMPEDGEVIDYKNLDKDDNRIENLRIATYSENSRNIARRCNNSTGFKGVSVFNSERNLKKFRSTITVDGKRIHLGQFATPEEAFEAYRKKTEELHGEFART
jgi:hypothetical protein